MSSVPLSESEINLELNQNSKCKSTCKWNALLSWEKPLHTGIFLLIVNIAYLIFKCLHLHLIPLLIQLTFISTIGHIALKKVMTEKYHKECSESEKEEMIEAIYKKVNECWSNVNAITSLKDKAALIRTLVILFTIITFGNWFSTLSLLVIIFDIFVLLRFGSIQSLITNITNDIIGIIGKILYDIIPKYKQEVQEESQSQSQSKSETKMESKTE